MQPDLPTSLVLGNARGEAIYCLMMALFFTVLAALVFLLLTRDTTFKKELRSVFGGNPLTLRRGRALALVVPLWLLACGWFYNATLGDRFHEVRRRADGGSAVWEFIYEYPHRVRAVPDAGIGRWTGQVGWERRSYRHCLYVELKSGRVLRSAGLHPDQFAEKAKGLEQWGIKVLPENKQ